MAQKIGFLIGRFQPLHAGHRELIRIASKKCDFLYLIIGSAFRPRSIKNPWTYDERVQEIKQFLGHENIKNVVNVPVRDYKYSDSQWISDICSIITRNVSTDDEVILFGHQKDGNNYLDWFPQYQYVNIESGISIDATTIRNRLFKDETARKAFHPDVVEDYLYFEKEKTIFSGYPFPETLNFNCSDAILECAGHILMIRRKFAPGINQWALPGGFKNRNETFIDCAIRELIEETNVRVPEKVIRGSIQNTKLFDSPSRSTGIPRNTMVVHIRVAVDPDGSLPRVSRNGSDDSSLCEWIPIKNLMDEYPVWEDHLDIISLMCSVNPTPAHLM
jgi:bifunctional NMN adenylyltransferase/nudix hydrolase